MDDTSLAVLIIGGSIAAVFGAVVFLRSFLLDFFERRLIAGSNGYTFYEVQLPRSNEVEIKAAEQMYAGLLGLGKRISGIKRLWTPKTFISFEVVAMKETIRFYVVCPKKFSSVVDRQINGTYSMAEINKVSEYNMFPEDKSVAFASLKLKKENRLPVQTYEELPVDTLATLTDAFSKLKYSDAGLFQLIISPSDGDWRNDAKKYLKKVRDTNSDPDKEKIDVNDDTLSLIEKKTTKSGFFADVRLVVVSDTEDEAEGNLKNILSSFDQYTKEGGNKFSKVDDKGLKKIVNDVVHRIPRETMILNIEELATLFHFPNKMVEAPFIQWLLSKKAPAADYIPNTFDTDYMYLGKNKFRGSSKEVFMKPADRMRHMYVVGQTGSGKSKLISSMMVRDIKLGHGCAFIDPHGSDAEAIIQQIPPERVEDVVIFDPADIERPLGLNMLEFTSDAQKTLAVNEMLNIFNTLYDLKRTGGPMFEQYFRYGIMLLTADPESGSTLMEMPKIFADDGYRAYKLSKCDDQEVVDFWEKQAMKAGGEASLKNVTPYVVSKLASFLTNAYVRPIVAQQTSTLDFTDIMNSGKILIAKLSKGRIGEFNASLLGMVLVGKILISALEREDLPQEQRRPFYLYIDEFQNFLTDGINQILSEARKYQLSLTLAHQFIGQLTREGNDTSIRDSIFGNVGNKAIFRVGANDAEFLVKELEGYFTEEDLIQQETATFIARILVDGKPASPFTASGWYGESPYDMITEPNPRLADIIRQISRLKYGKDANLIENELKLRGTFIKEQTESKAPAMPGMGGLF